MTAQFLRTRAWWRLDSAGPSAVHVARSVISLLDAAAYAAALPDDAPSLTALHDAGCFAGGIFDPGPEGWLIVRDWQLAEEATAGPEDLLAQLAEAADRNRSAAGLAGLAGLTHLADPDLAGTDLAGTDPTGASLAGADPTSTGLADPSLLSDQTIIIPRQLPGPAAERVSPAAEPVIPAPRR